MALADYHRNRLVFSEAIMTDREYEATLDRVKYEINNPIDNRNDHRYNDRIKSNKGNDNDNIKRRSQIRCDDRR